MNSTIPLTIKERYHTLEDEDQMDVGGLVDHLLCDVLTTIKELPGVEEAVLRAALKDNYYIHHFSPDTVGDIAFQYMWDKLMNPEEMS